MIGQITVAPIPDEPTMGITIHANLQGDATLAYTYADAVQRTQAFVGRIPATYADAAAYHRTYGYRGDRGEVGSGPLVRLYRCPAGSNLANENECSLVHGMFDVPLSAVDGITILDQEAPLVGSFHYMVRYTTDGPAGYAFEVTPETQLPPIWGGSCNDVILHDPARRGVWVRAGLMPISETTYDARMTVHHLFGRFDRVALSDARMGPSFTLTLLTRSDDDIRRMRAVGFTGEQVYLRIADPSYPESGRYYQLKSLSSSQPVPGLTSPLRKWEMEVVEVSPPAPRAVAPGRLTYPPIAWWAGV